jgi:hypothetical protein
MSYRNSGRGRDPYWTTAKFPGVCAKTGEPIKVGERIFYYPRTRKVFAGEAAEAAARDFEACRFDEAQAGGGW